MNENTATAVYLLENAEQKHDRRTAQAHARHATPNYNRMTIDSHGTTHPQPDAMTDSQLYAVADTAAFLTIRARSRNTGLKIWQDLQAQQQNDSRIMFDREARSIAEQAIRAEADRLNAEATAAERTAERMSTDPDTADTLMIIAEQRRTDRDNRRAEADEIAKNDSTATASERATLVQAAVAKAWELKQSRTDCNTVSELCKACSEALTQLTHPDTMTATRTVTRWLTAEDWETFRTAYAYDITATPPQKIPTHNTKSGAATYRTIEPKERKAERKKMTPDQLKKMAFTAEGVPICLIYHYRTTAAKVYYNDYENPDSIPELSTNGGINAIFNQTDSERINALFNRAKLTDRERLLITFAASQGARNAARKAEAAQREADREKIKNAPKKYRRQEQERAEQRAIKAGADARWAHAFNRLSRTDKDTSYTTATRDKYRQRIKAALIKARTAPEAPTAEERREADRRQWEIMQRNSRRACAPITAERIDLVAWTDSTTTDTETVVKWLTKAQANNRRDKALHATPNTSAKPTGYDERWILTAVNRWQAAINILALPEAGHSTAGQKERHRRTEADNRHPNTTPDVIITPENPKAAEHRRTAERWASTRWDIIK